MKKLSFREADWFVRGHADSKWQNKNLSLEVCLQNLSSHTTYHINVLGIQKWERPLLTRVIGQAGNHEMSPGRMGKSHMAERKGEILGWDIQRKKF